MAEWVGFDLPCGAGHLGLQGAPGALPSALGFESPRKPPKSKTAIPVGMAVSLLAEWVGFDLRCGGGHLGLQGAPGALLSALGFESLMRDLPKTKIPRLSAEDHCFWRSGWDSNPRAREGQRFSRPPRYDRFDTTPYTCRENASGRRFVRRPEKKWRRHPDLNRSNRGFAVRCLTTWLWRHWSGQRDSNSLPPPWQGGALPNELCPQMVPQARIELATRGFSVRCSTY